jgi:hypothetical protein
VLEEHELHPSKHVVEEVFEGRGMDALFTHLEALAQQPLHQNADAPPFEFVVLRSRSGKGPAAVVARVDHLIGDGISLARLIPCVSVCLCIWLFGWLVVWLTGHCFTKHLRTPIAVCCCLLLLLLLIRRPPTQNTQTWQGGVQGHQGGAAPAQRQVPAEGSGLQALPEEPPLHSLLPHQGPSVACVGFLELVMVVGGAVRCGAMIDRRRCEPRIRCHCFSAYPHIPHPDHPVTHHHTPQHQHQRQVLGTPMTSFDTDVGLTIPEKAKIVFTRRRRIVRIPTLKLSFVKKLKDAASATVNDVIYAATAGG